MKTVYAIDSKGLMLYEELEIGPSSYDEDENPIYDVPNGYVDTPLPSDIKGQLPFYRPKWTGTKWIEDKMQSEFDEEALLNSLTPSDEELNKAELEISIITILMEVLG